jgi:hypothetical protein
VLCDLVPGRVSQRITAGQAARVLDRAEPRSRRLAGPGWHPGNGSVASVAGLHPQTGTSVRPLPTLRPRPGPSRAARPCGPRQTKRPVTAHTSA